MSGDDDDIKPSPLWKLVSGAPYVPGPRPPTYRQAQEPPEDEPRYHDDEPASEEDLRLLRTGGHWAPRNILERLGPAPTEAESLPYLLVACAVLEGAIRIVELCGKVEYLAMAGRPRLEVMLRNTILGPRHGEIQGYLDQVVKARNEIPGTRARAANDVPGNRPDGLRLFDLRNLVHFVSAVIGATEVSARRNLLAVDFAIELIERAPDMHFVETWIDRLMPNAALDGVQFFEPPDFGRIVIVHDDGRLAYDPREEIEDDEDDEWEDEPVRRGDADEYEYEDEEYEDEDEAYEDEDEDEAYEYEDEDAPFEDSPTTATKDQPPAAVDEDDEWEYVDEDSEDDGDGEWEYVEE